MKRTFFFLFLFVSLSSVLFAQQRGPTAKPVTKVVSNSKTTITADELEAQVFSLVNNHRKSLGLNELKREWELDEIAMEHCKKMAKGEVGFSHSGFTERVGAVKKYARVPYKVSENLYEIKTPYENAIAKEAMKGWMGSPGHKSNMEKGHHLFTGIAVTKSANGTYYVTQLFVGKNPNPDPTKWKPTPKPTTKKKK
ncbi:MAG: CAP domain-containing protein [Bacteroidia bacterium]